MWVANAGDRTVTALDASTGAAFATVGVGGASSEPITAMSAGSDALHVLDGDDGLLTTVALATAAVTGSDKLPGEGEGLHLRRRLRAAPGAVPGGRLVDWFTDATGEYAGIAEDQGHVWASNRRTGQLVRDPVRTGAVSTRRSSSSRQKGSVLQVDPAVDLVRKVSPNSGASPGGTDSPVLSLAPVRPPLPGDRPHRHRRADDLGGATWTRPHCPSSTATAA